MTACLGESGTRVLLILWPYVSDTVVGGVYEGILAARAGFADRNHD